MWRIADEADDEAIVAMCAALNAEDPGTAWGRDVVAFTLEIRG